MKKRRALLESIFKAALQDPQRLPLGPRRGAVGRRSAGTDPFNRQRRLGLNARATEFDVHGLLTFLPKHLIRSGAS
jgi:hypothetical protein